MKQQEKSLESKYAKKMERRENNYEQVIERNDRFNELMIQDKI